MPRRSFVLADGVEALLRLHKLIDIAAVEQCGGDLIIAILLEERVLRCNGRRLVEDLAGTVSEDSILTGDPSFHVGAGGAPLLLAIVEGLHGGLEGIVGAV